MYLAACVWNINAVYNNNHRLSLMPLASPFRCMPFTWLPLSYMNLVYSPVSRVLLRRAANAESAT
jgi:hypothetical protein